MEATEQVIIPLRDGSIAAARKDGVIHARGIPYASSQRFQPPGPVPPWTGVRDCTGPATICPQWPSRLELVTGPLARGRQMSEDCTHLSVTAPAAGGDLGQSSGENGNEKLPVMVFFHGGAYLSGGGDLDCYQGLELARIRGVIVVSVTYRLGIFGYQFVPGVSPANLGLLDQIAALEWVQRNIGHFDGDAQRVTVFGESAGADSIFCLMISRGTEGLFQRAILQSAPFGRRFDPESDEMASVLSGVARDKLAGRPVADLTSADMLSIQGELIAAAKRVSPDALMFAPSLGHHPLPPRAEMLQVLSQRARDVSVLVGYTKHEGTAFSSINFPWASRYFTLPLMGEYIRSIASWVITKTVFQWPSDTFRKEVIKAGGKCSSFYFTWSPEGSWLGAAHTVELPFLLGSWDAWKNAPMLGGPQSQDMVETLGAEVKNVWAAFARGADLGPHEIIIDEGFDSTRLI